MYYVKLCGFLIIEKINKYGFYEIKNRFSIEKYGPYFMLNLKNKNTKEYYTIFFARDNFTLIDEPIKKLFKYNIDDLQELKTISLISNLINNIVFNYENFTYKK